MKMTTFNINDYPNAKKAFEDWYTDYIKKSEYRRNLIEGTYIKFFENLPFEMKYGVYLKFLDSRDLIIQVQHDFFPKPFMVHINNSMQGRVLDNRDEANIIAISKAFEMLETQLKEQE